ncbi:MAG: DUF4391 domain-containing protein [Sphaerochaetaceae bacterium]|nr:DUF4391 domain-containing protein [Sphaerochaetaceae bacterium]
MIFPKSTEVNLKIPKNRFYEKMDSKTKKYFAEKIESITILNKISKDTTNINSTKNVEEIFLIRITLKQEPYNFLKEKFIEDILETIDSAIPYAILFYLTGPEAKIGTKFKEKVFGVSYKIRQKRDSDNCKVQKVFLKKFNLKELDSFEAKLRNALNSINLELVYEKVVKLTAGSQSDLDLPDFVKSIEERRLLEQEIVVLESKVKSEKQADKQYDYFMKLKQKKEELGKLPS